MARSNVVTKVGIDCYFDLVFQVVSADESQYTMRAVVYLTSANISDSSNTFNVSEWGYSRGGGYSFSGTYSATPIWSQDISFSRVLNSNTTISVYAEISGVNYWGVTLSAREYYTVPAATSTPSPPACAVDTITATSAHVYVSAAGAENGLSADYCNYRIHRRSDGAHMGDLGGPGVGYGGVTFTNLARATVYDAYAQTHNAKGYGGFSGPYGFTTAATVPDPPAAPTAASITTSSFTVNWAAPANGGSALTGYQLQVDDDPAFGSPKDDAILSAATVSQPISGAAANTAYYVRVRAANANGYGAWSPVLTVTTGAAGPNPPTGLTVVSAYASAANLSWTAATPNGSPVTGYEIQVDTDPAFGSPDYSGTSPTVSTTAAPLVPNTLYRWRVRATSALGPSAWANGPDFTTSSGAYMSVGASNFMEGIYWMNVAGTWKVGAFWMNVGGVWKEI